MKRVPVSVVIPVRNGARFIAEALASVFEQTAKPVEIIVVDDGSTDETGAVVRRFADVTYIRQQPLGQAEARNHGIRLAGQQYLAFLDADDLWTPSKTALQLGVLSAEPKTEAVSGQMVQFRHLADGTKIDVSSPATVNLPGTMLFRRDAFQRVGPYSNEFRVGETIEWWARARDLGLRSHMLDSVVLKRRLHDANIGRTVEDPMRDHLKVLHSVLIRRRAERKP